MDEEIKIQEENLKELLRLMKENPNLPIVPFICSDTDVDYYNGYWQGRLDGVVLDEYIIADDNYTVFKSDDDVYDALERTMSQEEFAALPMNEDECRPHYEALPWTKAIILFMSGLE